MKLLIIIAFIVMIVFLMAALFSMMKDKGKSNRTVNALTWRIGIWVVLFAGLMTGIYTGVITPSNSLNPPSQSTAPQPSGDEPSRQ